MLNVKVPDGAYESYRGEAVDEGEKQYVRVGVLPTFI